MKSWTGDYVCDVEYTVGFYPDQSASALSFVALLNGYDAPPLGRFAYCELGCGMGLTANILAAANPDLQLVLCGRYERVPERENVSFLGPLGREGDHHAHDLCAIHTDRLSVPKGWVVIRHETLRV